MLTVGGGGDGRFSAWLHPPEPHDLGKATALSDSIWSSVGETQPQVFLEGRCPKGPLRSGKWLRGL